MFPKKALMLSLEFVLAYGLMITSYFPILLPLKPFKIFSTLYEEVRTTVVRPPSILIGSLKVPYLEKKD